MTSRDEVRHPASFRDPSGFVFQQDGRIRRAVTAYGLDNARAVRATGLLDALIADGLLLAEQEIATSMAGRPDVRLVLEHPRLPFISYPYEWPFLALQAAAVLHLDVQLRALDAGIMLTDASAYNVQFVGAQPVFIDHLSFRPYREGELWSAHRQFCEQFLHPLLLRSLVGIEYQPWYRGRPDGIGGEDVVRMLRLTDKLRWNVLVNVVLPERLQRRAATASMDATVRKGHLSRAALREMWSSLRRWIARLQPKGTGSTTWGRYDETVPEGEVAAIATFVSQFVERVQPQLLWDLGCNAGRYSEVALGAGAGYVVGLDSDAGAADKAFARARDRQLRLLPLLVDLLNPTPTQGWQERERDNLLGRGSGDALLAVAVVHHLAARNAPLGEIIELLTAIAPEGVIGFVPRTDARARQLFSARDDMFASYTLENFVALLRGRARIVQQEVLPGSERVLIWFSTR